jgi:endonuclease/exonuclease/phosphatase family metal-dependent hydrolase
VGGSLRVGTYNIYLGADLSLILGPRSPEELVANRLEVQRQLAATAFPQRAPAIAGLLVRERLDLVGLQEVCTWHLEGELVWDFGAELLAALETLGEPYDVLCSEAAFGGTGEVAGPDGPAQMRLRGSNVILARRSAHLEVESTRSGMFGSTLRMPADTAMVAIARGWCAARLRYDEAEFSFVNTHTEAYGADWRDRQRDELLEALPPDSEPVIVVGDFNATPDQVGMPPSYVDAWTASGHASDDPAGATCCQAADLRNEASTLTARIDYVWARGFDVRSSARFGGEDADRTDGGLWPSDHAGVAVELTP